MNHVGDGEDAVYGGEYGVGAKKRYCRKKR